MRGTLSTEYYNPIYYSVDDVPAEIAKKSSLLRNYREYSTQPTCGELKLYTDGVIPEIGLLPFWEMV